MAPPIISKELPPKVKALIDAGVPAIAPRKPDRVLVAKAEEKLNKDGVRIKR